MRFFSRGSLALIAVTCVISVAADRPNLWLGPILYAVAWLGAAMMELGLAERQTVQREGE